MMITNKKDNYSDLNFVSGESILIDKPLNWSSFKVIYELRKKAGIKKAGHAGTLDPKATGLLIICTGKKTKEITSFQDLTKTYTGTILLGKKTPSMDMETEVSEENPYDHITKEMINKSAAELTGAISQVPPMYSAIKLNGKTLYNLARKGKTVAREPREINVYEFKITDYTLPEIHFKISCSKGTYIRVLAHDLGDKLGCGAVLSSLRRTKIGEYHVDDALNIEDFIQKVNAIPEVL
ncbi:MAG: tRNA pseudouridine(55) synthase TruB [Syntrophothermus sp.]